MKKKTLLHAIIFTTLISTGACSNQVDHAMNVPANTALEEIGQPEYQQIPTLKREALAGSSRAAMQLSLWYMKFPNGKYDDYYWTQIAAENGSAAGQFNMAHKLLSDESDPLNAVRARYWLTLSSKQGALQATAKLAELDKAEKP